MYENNNIVDFEQNSDISPKNQLNDMFFLQPNNTNQTDSVKSIDNTKNSQKKDSKIKTVEGLFLEEIGQTPVTNLHKL